MSSGATTSAGRAKKDGGRCWEGVVAMGLLLRGGARMVWLLELPWGRIGEIGIISTNIRKLS